MPRINRTAMLSSFLHVMIQGINKEMIFEKDYYKTIYLKYLNESIKNYNVRILVYAIMNNHAHFLFYCEDKKIISKVMGIANSRYAKFYNKQNNRVGYVFRDRFKSKQILNKEYLYNVIAYIHNNPKNAGLVTKLEDYQFSSYKMFISNQISKEDKRLLFQIPDNGKYIELFNSIHKKYSIENVLREETNKNYEDVINQFIFENKLRTLNDVKKNNKLLISLIRELRIKTNLKDSKISEILKIGKNRIYLIMNK